MDNFSADQVASITKKVAAYGGQLSTVFHSHSLSAERIPPGFEGAINVLDATVATLNQVLSLLEVEAAGVKAGVETGHFSRAGLEYVTRLAVECATTLAKVEPIVGDACLNAKELKAKRRREKRELAKNGPPKLHIDALDLDQKSFLETVETAKWSLATAEIEECMERLYDLQLHLLLVFQVVTVEVMSRDVLSGKVDIKSIVTFHDRIQRTAELVGIKLPKGRSRNKRSGYDSSSDSGSLFDSASSDSDNSSLQSFRRPVKVKESCPIVPPTVSKGGPPPPPPTNWPGGPPRPPPQPRAPPSCVIPGPLPSSTMAGSTGNSVNPPSYSESKPTAPACSSTTSTLLGTVSQTASTVPTESISSEKSDTSQESVYPAEKELAEEIPTKKEEIAPPTLEPRLFKSNTKGLRFKAKNLFRSTKSLAEEMKKVLRDADSTLLAVIIQSGNIRQVPHSAFHSLEATHMRTILSQIDKDQWYDTFTKMDYSEHVALERLLRPFWVKGEKFERELVVLKVVHEKENAWVALLRNKISRFPTFHASRVLLAIVREKLLDGKPLPMCLPALPGPPPPPPMPSAPLPPPSGLPTIRPPPGLPTVPTRSTKTSDLRYGPPSSVPQPPQPTTGYAYGGTVPPVSQSRPDPPPGTVAMDSIRVSDTTPLTDYEATLALTTYAEYTLRLTDALNPGLPRSWSRVTVTQESAEKHLILQRIQAFQRAGGNVLEAKLHLTEQQGSQVTRLMDELKAGERDLRFEWCWVELSLYNSGGEITDFASGGGFPRVNSATMMHLIAKRMPKAHCKPLDLYNTLMRPSPPPIINQPPVIIHNIPRARSRSRSRSRSRDNRRDYYSDSSSVSSLSSDDSSVGYVRRRLRKNKAKKISRKKRASSRYYSDSDTEESEEEDVIKIKLELKRGDDVVQALLALWTPQVEPKGKGKETEEV